MTDLRTKLIARAIVGLLGICIGLALGALAIKMCPADGPELLQVAPQSGFYSAPGADMLLAPTAEPIHGDLIVMTRGERRCRFPGAAGERGYVDLEKIVPKDAGPTTCCKMVVTPCGEERP